MGPAQRRARGLSHGKWTRNKEGTADCRNRFGRHRTGDRACVKCEEPAVRGGLFKFSGMMFLPAYALTRDARNVGAHDAEIGKLAVAEQVELTLGAIVTVPALETIGEQVEHCLSPMD